MIIGCFSPGTTPTHTFTLPFEKEMLAEVRITYTQNKKRIITKEIDDLEINGNDISLTLTQEETFLFEEGKNVSIQLKIKTTEGLVFNSNVMKMRVDPSLDKEVI
jgi:hypothetical protein